MKRSTPFIIAVLFPLLSVLGDQPGPIELKNKSSFNLRGDRNPFWPIGWKPSGAASFGDHASSDIPSYAIVVSSIAIEKSGRFAIINGKIIQEGQQFGLQIGASTYQITLKSIEDGKVVLVRRDQEIIVPLRRK